MKMMSVLVRGIDIEEKSNLNANICKYGMAKITI